MEDILYKNSPSDIRIREMVNIVPNSEEQEQDYSKKYLTFEAIEDCIFTLTIPSSVNQKCMTSVSYSTDNGTTWTTTNNSSSQVVITTPTITAGNKVLWKGIGVQMAKEFYSYSNFGSTGQFNVSGNIMSMLYGDEFVDKTTFQDGSVRSFTSLFGGMSNLQNAENLILPATTLVNWCYQYMFQNCRSLKTAPLILATVLADGCCGSMFTNCVDLTVSPELLANTLVANCYSSMFGGCSKLNCIRMYATDVTGSNCLYSWVNGVAGTGTFIKNANANWDITGSDGVPTNWNIQLIDLETGEILPPT